MGIKGRLSFVVYVPGMVGGGGGGSDLLSSDSFVLGFVIDILPLNAPQPPGSRVCQHYYLSVLGEEQDAGVKAGYESA